MKKYLAIFLGVALLTPMSVFVRTTGPSWYVLGAVILVLSPIVSLIFKNRRHTALAAMILMLIPFIISPVLSLTGPSDDNDHFMDAYEAYGVAQDDFESLKAAIIAKPFQSAKITPIGVILGNRYEPINRAESIVISSEKKTSLSISTKSRSIEELIAISPNAAWLFSSDFEGRITFSYDQKSLYSDKDIANRTPYMLESSGVHTIVEGSWIIGGEGKENIRSKNVISNEAIKESHPVVFESYSNLKDKYYYQPKIDFIDSAGQLYLQAQLAKDKQKDYGWMVAGSGLLDAEVFFRVDGISMKNEVTISGTIRGTDNKALPRMKVDLQVYYDVESIPQNWSEGHPNLNKSLAADLNGVFSVKIPIQNDMRTKIGVIITLTLRCVLPTGDAYFLADHQDQNAKDEIHVSTLVTVDPADILFNDKEEITISRAMPLYNLPLGFLTFDDNQEQEPMQTNLGDTMKFPGYSYVYRLLWDALTVGGVLFDELPNLLNHPSGEPLMVDCNYGADPDNPGGSSHYSTTINAIRLTSNHCCYDDSSRFNVLHEFGHFVDAATNEGDHRCGWASKITANNPNHGGYLNSDTADSFVEGFATWFACVCQLYRKDANPFMTGHWNLMEPGDWKAWMRGGTEEEFSIASTMARMMYVFGDFHDFWSILKNDFSNFYGYYDKCRSVLGKDSVKMLLINSYIRDAGLFRMPSGNGQYDLGEPYRDQNKDGTYNFAEPFTDTNNDKTWNPGEPYEDRNNDGIYNFAELYGDLMYPFSPDYGMIDTFGYPASVNPQAFNLGESAAYNYPNRKTIALRDNCFISLSGEKVSALKVAVRLTDGASYAYVMTPTDRGIYIGLSNGEHEGQVEISVPGGKTIYRGDVHTLQDRISRTVGQSIPLDTADISKADLAPAGTLAAPTGGDVDASGIFEPVRMSNQEAAILAENYDPEADVSAVLDVKLPEIPSGLETVNTVKHDLVESGNKPQSPIKYVAAGVYHSIGLKNNGALVSVGYNDFGQCDVRNWTDIITVAAGKYHTIGLKSNGQVLAAGSNESGQCDVNGWEDVISVSACENTTIGLRRDGTVCAAGDNTFGQCNVSDWSGIVAVSAGSQHTVGLRSDGTVVAAGDNQYRQCNVSKWTGIIDISAGYYHTVGLKNDGTLIAIGYNEDGRCDLSLWSDIVDVSAGGYHTVGIRRDGTAIAVGYNLDGQCDVGEWTGIVEISTSKWNTVSLKKDGTAVAVGYNYYGQCDVNIWEE